MLAGQKEKRTPVALFPNLFSGSGSNSLAVEGKEEGYIAPLIKLAVPVSCQPGA